MASFYLEAGRLPEAEREIRRLRHRGEDHEPCCGPCDTLWAELLWKANQVRELEEFCAVLLRVERSDSLAVARLYLGQISFRRGRYQEVVEALRPLLDDPSFDTLDAEMRGLLLALDGRCWRRLRDFDAARASFQTALAHLEAAGRREHVADCLMSLGLCEKSGTDWNAAEILHERALEAYLDLGSPVKILIGTTNLAVFRVFRGWFQTALDPARRAVALASELEDSVRLAAAETNLGLLFVRLGRPGDARRTLLSGYRGAVRTRNTRNIALACEYLGEFALREGRLTAARRWLHRAQTLVVTVPERDILAETERLLAEVELMGGLPSLALGHAQSARSAFEQMEDLYETAVAFRVEGQILLRLGHRAEAKDALHCAAATLTRMGERFEIHRVQALLAAIELGTDGSDIRFSFDPAIEAHPGAQHAPDPIARGLAEVRDGRPDTTTRSRRSGRGTEARASEHPDFPGLLGQSPKLLSVLDYAREVASMEVPILIQGETGTGKEILARSIHALSPWNEGPYVPYNCAGGSAELLDAEFFGHRKGSFTGALSTREGLVKAAMGGTLFLDEIAELALELQPRLLRLLDTGEIRPVGSDRPEYVQVRIVCATHQTLERRVAGGGFRRDLYHRLAAISLTLPPLRERGDDIAILVRHFVEMARVKGRPYFAGVGGDALARMLRYSWPGNVRQLRNEVMKLASRTPPFQVATDWTPPAEECVEGVKSVDPGRDRIEDELRGAHGNLSLACERLGITRQRFYRLCERYGVDYRALR